jgi:hypothetical protein
MSAVVRRLALRLKDYAQRGAHPRGVLPVRAHFLSLAAEVRDGRPPPERCLFRFEDEAALAEWQTFSDSEYGGSSSAQLELRSQGESVETCRTVLTVSQTAGTPS